MHVFYTPILLEVACSFSQDSVLASQRLTESHGLVVITFDTGVNRSGIHTEMLAWGGGGGGGVLCDIPPQKNRRKKLLHL